MKKEFMLDTEMKFYLIFYEYIRNKKLTHWIFTTHFIIIFDLLGDIILIQLYKDNILTSSNTVIILLSFKNKFVSVI